MTASRMPFQQRTTRSTNMLAASSVLVALLLPLTLIAGLLSFPTSCACGAELPHDHALFALSHHHHDHHGEPAGDGPADDLPETQGAAVSSPSSTVSSVVQPAVMSGASLDHAAAGRAPLWLAQHPATGTQVRPESPPPQI